MKSILVVALLFMSSFAPAAYWGYKDGTNFTGISGRGTTSRAGMDICTLGDGTAGGCAQSTVEACKNWCDISSPDQNCRSGKGLNIICHNWCNNLCS